MTPRHFVGTQIGGVARQEMQGQLALNAGNVFAHADLLVRRKAANNQKERPPAILHHPLRELDKQLSTQCTFVRAVESHVGIDRRGSAHRLAPPSSMHHRRLTKRSPSLAVHSVRVKSEFVSNLRVLRLRALGNGRVGFTLPFLEGPRIALARPLQWLLRRQSQSSQPLPFASRISTRQRTCSVFP